jgi:Acyl dehydratase
VTESDGPVTAATGLYFDDFEIGQKWVTPGRTITEVDIVNFAGFSGDYMPVHTDAEYASRTPFGQRIMHGPGAFAITTGLWTRLGINVDTAIAFLEFTCTLRAPVFIGDTIRLEMTVADLRPSNSKPDRGIVTFECNALKQDDTVCQSGRWTLMFWRRPGTFEQF